MGTDPRVEWGICPQTWTWVHFYQPNPGTARNAESPECIMQRGPECLTPECITTRPGMPNDRNA